MGITRQVTESKNGALLLVNLVEPTGNSAARIASRTVFGTSVETQDDGRQRRTAMVFAGNPFSTRSHNEPHIFSHCGGETWECSKLGSRRSISKENRMPIESITLHCVRKDGRRETTELSGHTMTDARELAKWVLNHWNGVYAEVDICVDDRTVERVRNPAVPSSVGTA